MRELFKVVKKSMYVLLFILGIIYSLSETGESLALAHFATSPLNETKLLYLIISIVVCDLMMWGTNWFISYLENYNYIKSNTRIAKYYFTKIEKMTTKNIASVHTGYIQNMIFEVSELFGNIMWHIETDLTGIIIGITTFVIMACTQSIWTGIICMILFIAAIICKYMMLKSKKKYDKELRSKRSESKATLIDFIQNIITVKKLNIHKYCLDRIDNKNEEYLKAANINERKRANMNLIFHLITSSVYVVVLISTLIMTKNGGDALPYLLFYMTLLGRVYGSINGFVWLIDGTVQFHTAKSQLEEKIGELVDFEVVQDFRKVELLNSTFKYNDNSVEITIPDFKLNKGDKISIMGESGQGKTTVMNILAGLYELEKGQLLIDGKEIDKIRLDLVFVSQEVDLFDMSIRENLCLGKDISEEKILSLFEDAGLMDWYNNLENGLDTVVGEKGIKLSAGQKQRLNLIRGILIDKDLYFFDEPTSNLDSVSEEKITNMIEKYLKDKTYVIVTHRPRLTDLCNKHYIFENHTMKEYQTMKGSNEVFML